MAVPGQEVRYVRFPPELVLVGDLLETADEGVVARLAPAIVTWLFAIVA